MQLQKEAENLREREQWEEASEMYRQAIILNPTFSWSYSGLGECLLRLRRWREATIYLKEAIQLNPDFVWAYSNLGEALSRQKKWKPAIEAYSHALRLTPNLNDVSQKLSHATWQLSKVDEEAQVNLYKGKIQDEPDNLQNYYKAIQVNPSSYTLHAQLADTLLRIGKKELAIASYKVALQLQPDHADTKEKLRRLAET